MMLRALVFATVSATIAVLPVRAQEHWGSPSLTASLGGGHARGGGAFRSRTGIATDALLAWRVRPARRGAVVIGLAGGWQGSTAGSDDCLVSPSGGCVPRFPSVSSVASLAGWESGRPRSASVRLAAGPALYHGLGSRTVGIQGRMELATPAPFHVAIVAFGRADVLPRLSGNSYVLGAAGFGFRIR